MSENVSREALERLVALVRRWSPTLNLVSRGDLPLLWERHVADCLQLLPLLPPALERAIDLGSGAGFPGLVLAIAARLPVDLIEADQRKAAFLREAARITGASASIHPVRIEAVTLPPARLVTARALAPLPRLLPWVAANLAPDGIALLPKGAGAASELTAARREWQMEVQRIPSRTAPGAVILQISELRRVPRPA